MSKYTPGQVNERLDLAALPSESAVSEIFDETVLEETLISSLEAMYSWAAVTRGTDDGPLMVGIAHSDYTTTEIEQWIENINSWDWGDLSQREVTNRLIRKIGVFQTPIDTAETVVLNHGRPIKTKLNWSLRTGQSLRLWAYNLGSSAFADGGQVHADGKANLWRK